MSTLDSEHRVPDDRAGRVARLSEAKRAVLARRLGAVPAAPPVTVPRRDADAVPVLSWAQERLWFMEQFAPGAAGYTVPVVLRLRGPLDPDAVRRALDGCVARHDSLRTGFSATADGTPLVHLVAPAPVPLTVLTVDAGSPDPQSGGPSGASAGSPAAGSDGASAAEPDDGSDVEAATRALVAAELARPFDLTAPPLLRATLFRLGPEDHVLLLAIHHIVCDGWSAEVLVGEIRAHLAAEARGVPPALPEPPVRYADYAAWQRQRADSGGYADGATYWLHRLAGLPPLELPTDRVRPERQTFAGATHTFRIGAELTRRLVALGRRHNATPHMTLLAAYQVMLSQRSGQRDFAVGCPVAGRTVAELDPTVGLFLNMLTMRAELAGDPSFAQLLERTRDAALDAYAHQELPFERVVSQLKVARDVRRSPLFQVIFAFQSYGGRSIHPGPNTPAERVVPAAPLDPGAGPRIEPFDFAHPATRFDLELYVAPEADGGLHCTLVYNRDLFTSRTCLRFVDHLRHLLAGVVEAPDRRLSELDLLPADERDTLLRRWNRPAVPVTGPATLAELVEERVRRVPDTVAVRYEGRSVTYAELNARANQVAHRLRAAGVGRDDVVAVCAERSVELVVALLGVVKAGAAYLPLDPDHPARRLSFMLADSGARVLLRQRHVPALSDDPAVGTLPSDGPVPDTLLLDDPTTWADQPRHDPAPLAGPDDLAYVIYTSGSTGQPKGVLMTHRAVVNRLDWMQRTYRLGADDAVLQKTPAGFDVSVWEFFWPLASGARLVLARPGGHKDAAYLRDLIVAESVTVTHFVPSMLTVFLAEEVTGCRSLRLVVCSGEALAPGTAAEAVRALPGAELHNLYGPTEAAIDVSAWHCRPETLDGRSPVPIGHPIRNITLHVLNEHLDLVPVGAPGQLYIAGVGLARGYLGRPGLTAERFLADPYGPPGSRIYATGDLVRRRSDGAIEFLGRIDNQVKLRGLRIELGEIEVALRDQPGVAEVAVVAREDTPGDQRLVAYLVPGAGAAPEPARLRAALKESLPDYMVPSAFVPVEVLPLSPNGKLDRAALPAPQQTRAVETEFVEPRTATEEAVAAVWRAVLGLPRVGVHDDFFELGGHSLLGVQVVARLRTAVPAGGSPVSVMDLFTHATVARLAELLDTPVDQRGPRRLLHELTPAVPAGQRTRSLVCVPYGGGSAVVYQPLADALPAGHSLYSVSVPGHDLGLAEDPLPLAEVARRCVAEILERVSGPLVLYGHCGLGSALIVEIARQLDAAGRELEAVYIGAVFPFARPTGRVLSWLGPLLRQDRLASYRHQVNWLKSMGVDVDELGPEQARRIVQNMRHDFRAAEEYFTGLLDAGVPRLRAPVISVVGDRDPSTDYAQERYREWEFLGGRTALVVIDEGGHYFLKYRAEELAEIVTGTHVALAAGPTAASALAADRVSAASALAAAPTDAATLAADSASGRRLETGWWLDRYTSADGTETVPAPTTGGSAGPDSPGRPDHAGRGPAGAGGTARAPEPSMWRFLAVVGGQLASMTGSALTEFAVPIWIYTETGSLARFAIFFVVGLVPGMLVAPLAGAIVDRYDRRRVMLGGDIAALVVQLVFGLLLWTDNLRIWHIYVLLAALSCALTFQRLAFTSAVPQLVPKRYLGHANGFAQTAAGIAQFVVPLVAVGLMASIGLGGILAIDVVTYTVVIGTLLVLRFPATMAYRRRETLLAEIRGGLTYTLNHRGIRAMLLFFAVLNIFLGPLILLVSPLVLSFADLSQVGQVAFGGALGVVLGGLTMTVWGGPARRRMRGMLIGTAALAVCCLVAGLRPATAPVAAGVFGMMFALTLVNAIYATIVQVTVPQRFHGRVFALNTIVAWSTLPLGFAVIVPFGPRLLDPLLAEGGALAGTVGQVIGVGPGRGIGLMYLISAIAMVVLALTCLRVGILARFDTAVRQAPPDDLFGVSAREERRRQEPGLLPTAVATPGTARRGTVTPTVATRHNGTDEERRRGPAAPPSVDGSSGD
ncbi:non-ribosomal peptide synthetase/MFS transporter [Plantactinospora sonchi]|uniref:Amino acid adenylation domain-containing protein n=1 Tax=Plantactinospora sonchi TaxID=1544735 RepID=A0ABU7RWT0_9ACTN